MTDGPTVVGGRYQLQELVGRGGMAEVHRGLDLRLGRPVAVKLLSTALAADPTAQTRFRREAQAAASLNDPNIASVYDTGEDTDPATGVSIPYIVMELVEGSTLRAMLDDGPLTPAEALRISASVLAALAHSHDAGIIHRDIKPANVMVTPSGAVKVMDFGIARATDDTSAHLTQTSAVIGTAQYLSPEQARGEQVDLRSDLYSVGCLLFELVAGRPPFVGETSVSVAYQHVREAPVPPSSLNPAVPADLDAIVLHALAKDRDDRYPSARAMRDDVERLLGQLDDGTAPGPLAAHAALAAAAVGADPTVLAGPPATLPVPAAAAVVTPAQEPEQGRRSAARVLLVAAAVLLVLGLGAFGLVRLLGPQADSASGSVVVPQVVGSTRAEADAQLREADLVARFRDVRGKAGATVDTVTKQNPAPGGSVASGTVVTLDLNVGPATAGIPEGLVGRDVDDVRDALDEAGFTDVKTERVPRPSEDVAAGEVVSLDPEAGEQIGLDETILVRYADDRGTSGSEPTGGSGGSGGGGGGGDDDDEPESSASPDASPTSRPTGTATSEPSRPASPEPSEPESSASTGPTESAEPEPSEPEPSEPEPSEPESSESESAERAEERAKEEAKEKKKAESREERADRADERSKRDKPDEESVQP